MIARSTSSMNVNVVFIHTDSLKPRKFTTDRIRINAAAGSTRTNYGKELEKYPERPMATAAAEKWSPQARPWNVCKEHTYVVVICICNQQVLMYIRLAHHQ